MRSHRYPARIRTVSQYAFCARKRVERPVFHACSCAVSLSMTGILGPLIPIAIRLVRALDRDADVVSLRLRQLRELRADLGEMQASDLVVELLRQHVDLRLVVLRVHE